MSDTKAVKDSLKIRYGNMCMLTGVRVKLTYHHTIVKRVDTKSSRNPIKGETVANGSLLTELIHCKYLHSILERNCPICYEETMILICKYKEAMDNKDWEYVEWHRENVMPLFKRQLDLMHTKKNKQRSRCK